jgi:hypothetical protein
MLRPFTRLRAPALLLLLLLPATVPVQGTAAELAPIAVSLVVQETCEIRSMTGSAVQAEAPSVSCLHSSPYDLAQAPVDPVQPQSSLRVASGSVQPAVWTVAF